MTFADLKDLLSVLQTLLVPVLGYGMYRLNKIDDSLLEIRNHLAMLNGKVGTCDALRQAHEKDDDRKHDNCEERVEKIEKKLMGIS